MLHLILLHSYSTTTMPLNNQADHDGGDAHEAELSPAGFDDAPPSYDDANRTKLFDCPACKAKVEQKHLVFSGLCQDCALRTSLRKCTSCSWTVDTKDGFETGICTRCAPRLDPDSEAIQRLHYCAHCKAEMYPPTSKSRPFHSRLCYQCELARIAGFASLAKDPHQVPYHFCKRCDWVLKVEKVIKNGVQVVAYTQTNGLCPLCYLDLEREKASKTKVQRIMDHLPWRSGKSKPREELSDAVEIEAHVPRPRRYSLGRARLALAALSASCSQLV